MVWGVLLDVGGWMGALVLIVAYGFISWGRLSGSSGSYQSLNIAGSLLLLINAAWHHAWPSSVVNLVWIGIALSALIRRPKGARERALSWFSTHDSSRKWRLRSQR
jgi:hypothetical protein